MLASDAAPAVARSQEMTVMTKLAVSDVCLVTHDLEGAIAFYQGKLGFELAHRMPGFADFTGPGATLAVWDAEAIRAATSVPAWLERPIGHGVMVAVELPSPAAIDEAYERLTAAGIEFYDPPKDYPWTARAVYFAGPCGEFWELYAWVGDGEPGAVASGS